ncbi:MAG: ABC transporter ATP-binding protein [Lachnospiraceae bacterium]|nr:ABC transporter ATP-binding protein [Lachnospiraceae bacterium]
MRQMEQEKLVQVKNLKKYYPVGGMGKKKVAKALDGVSFDIYAGETLGLVGESGCGKTTVGRAILRLISVTEGEIWFEDQNITNYSEKQMRPLRSQMQIIFQDPYGCLDPRKTVYDLIAAPLKLHGLKDREALRSRVLELMEEVGLRADYIDRYPHEFSGGQRQRIGIARAIAINPRLIVCDEPVSALDVSVQAQVINLIRKLQKEHGLTYLFISHDLRVIKHLCDRIVVMYLGTIVESGKKEDIYRTPAHPYTKALLSAVPEIGSDMGKTRTILQGDIPSPIDPPEGCRFHTRCPVATEKCAKEIPPRVDLGGGHFCCCHYCGNDSQNIR